MRDGLPKNIGIMEIPKLISIHELSEKLGLSISTLYSWSSQKKIPCVKLGGALKFNEKDVANWVRKQTIEPRQVTN